MILLENNHIEQKRKNLVFVSYEIHPVNPGGCGVFLSHALEKLLVTNQYEITLLLDMPKHECDLFERKYKLNLPNSDLVRVICLSDLLSNIKLELTFEDLQNAFLWKSYCFYQGLLQLEKMYPLDYVEFFDYAGVGYYAIKAKKYEGKFINSIFGIRAHCTIDLMDAQQAQSELSLERIVMYEMEKISMLDSDVLMVPSNAWRELYIKRYNVLEHKVLISPPPMSFTELPKRTVDSKEDYVLFYGRLFGLKGVDTYIDAAIQYITENPSSSTKFYVIGYDGQTPSGGSYKNYLLEKIPSAYKERFIFTGFINRAELSKIIKRVQVAVFPNYIESFSYSIHEIYYAGVPIICRAIPAFKDYFVDGDNCLHFDGTIQNLASKIKLLLSNSELRRQLSYPYPVLEDATFLSSYEDVFKFKINPKINHSPSSSISFVFLEECENDNSDIDSILSLLPKKSISREKSYALNIQKKGEQDVPVHFLGKTWYVTGLFNKNEFDKTLSLEQYVWVGTSNEVCTASFYEQALSVFKQNEDIHYVSCYSTVTDKNDNQVTRCLPYDLISGFLHWQQGMITNFLVKVPLNYTLRDLYEPRLNSLGQYEYIRKKGYTIPQLLHQVRQKGYQQKSERDWYSLKFAVHHGSIEKEWEPSSLTSLLYLQQSQEQNVELASVVGFSWKRLALTRIKTYLNSKNGWFGRFQYKIFRSLYQIIRRFI